MTKIFRRCTISVGLAPLAKLYCGTRCKTAHHLSTCANLALRINKHVTESIRNIARGVGSNNFRIRQF